MKYLKAQLLLCVIMGVLGRAIVLFADGRFALLIGLWVGVTEIIPVLGMFVGAVPEVLIPLLWVLFATMVATALYGPVGGVPIVATIAAVFRHLRGTLLFERWHKAPVFALDDDGTANLPQRLTYEDAPAGTGGKSSPETGV